MLTLKWIRTKPNPIVWLTKNLHVTVSSTRTTLQVQLPNFPREESEYGVKLVNATLEAYKKEVAYKSKSRLSLAKDKLGKLRDQTKKELKEKIDRHQTLAKALGGKESDESAAIVQIITNRLDRIEMNFERLEEEQLLLQLELEQTEAEPSSEQKVKLAFFERRLAQLEERRVELFEKLGERSKSSGALALLKSDIEQLRDVVREMDLKLRSKAVEEATEAPPRIKILQPATIDPAASSPSHAADQ